MVNMDNPRHKRFSPTYITFPKTHPAPVSITSLYFCPRKVPTLPLPHGIRLFTWTLGALNFNFSLFWVCCAGQAILGGCCARVHCEILSQFNTIYLDHLLLSGQQREGGIEAFIKPSNSFILGNLHIATVNFHLLL